MLTDIIVKSIKTVIKLIICKRIKLIQTLIKNSNIQR